MVQTLEVFSNTRYGHGHTSFMENSKASVNDIHVSDQDFSLGGR